MFRLLVIYALLQTSASQQSSSFLDNVFNENINYNKTVEGLKCTGIVGSADLCMNCFTCNDEAVRGRKHTFRLTLKDSNCATTQVCCIGQQDLRPRNSDRCGAINPEGLPRRRRPSLRSVLEREYPWRAWIYSSNDQKPLCSATYIDSHARALLTTASCVSGRQPSSLTVKFTKTQVPPNRIKKVIIHEHYDKALRKNNIALLTLESSPGPRVLAACLPATYAPHGTSCVAVSDSETYINTVIPQQTTCTFTNNDNTTICSVSPSDEFKSQEGAGVYCLDDISIPTYNIYGIYQNVNRDKVLSDHTNVPHYYFWIKQKIID